MKFTIAAIKNNYAPSMRGYTHYKFASIKDANGNYGPWIRLDKLPDVKILSHAVLRWNVNYPVLKGGACENKLG